MSEFHSSSRPDAAPTGALPGQAGSPSSAIFAARLDNYALFAVTGEDAVGFLHGQLTNDVKTLDGGQARLAGYCTPKGRLLATMLFWRQDVRPVAGAEDTPAAAAPTILGAMRAAVAPAVLKRLQMFVLRAKVKFSEPGGSLTGVWCGSGQYDALCAAAGGALPTTPWQKVELSSGTWICAPHDANALRWWWIDSRSQPSMGQTEADPPAPNVDRHALSTLLQPATVQAWQHGELVQGLPWIEDTTQDLFIPQTVNLDLIDGVNFTKGCYPGQEIVARSHYLGKVKRRMTLGSASGDIAAVPAADIFLPHGSDEPVGRVVDAAFDGATTHVLLETTLSAMAEPSLHLGRPDGPAITLKSLPYALA